MTDPTPTPGSGLAPATRVAISAGAGALALACALGLSLLLRHQAAGVSRQQPTPEAWLEAPTPASPVLASQGRRLFLSSCAHCHGADASGAEGPDLHQVEVSDRYIFNIITHGIKHEMPSFAKKLGKEDIAKLTAYVRSLD